VLSVLSVCRKSIAPNQAQPTQLLPSAQMPVLPLSYFWPCPRGRVGTYTKRSANARAAMDRDVLNQILYFGLTIAILISGVIALKMQFSLLSKMKASPNDVLRIFVITLIVTFGLATTALKSADELKELAPIYGLFGTIAGYLLGSATRRRSARYSDERDDHPSSSDGPKNSN